MRRTVVFLALGAAFALPAWPTFAQGNASTTSSDAVGIGDRMMKLLGEARDGRRS